jgi:hypothetical protein
MNAAFRFRWPFLLLSVLVIGAAWLGRWSLDSWTRQRLARQHVRTLVRLPESQAAEFVRRLTLDDGEWLDVVVGGLADSRAGVAEASEGALWDLVDRWAHLPAGESSPRVAALASLLAQEASVLPSDRRTTVRALAERLISWPVDGRLVDVSALVANCQAVLELPSADAFEIQVASVPARVKSPPDVAAPPAEPPLAKPVPEKLPPAPRLTSPSPPPAHIAPQQPAPLADANREAPVEPRQFIPPKAIRISDE